MSHLGLAQTHFYSLILQRFALVLLACAIVSYALAASLEAPHQANIGSDIEVNWDGERYTYDSIYVADPATPDNSAGLAKSTRILSNTGAVAVRMPDRAGQFELRYWSAQQKEVLARRAIEILDVPSSLEAPASAGIGANIAVQWVGPGTAYDRIELYPTNASDGATPLAGTAITSGKNPVQLTLPEVPGDYEIRYVTQQSGRVLATRSIIVNEVPATIEAPERANMGETIEIAWTGPGNSYDRIELHTEGATVDAKPLRNQGLLGKSPISFRLPEEPGRYELRYTLRQSGRVLVSKAITIGATEASIDSPDRALAASSLNVGWSGPGNNYDRIEVHAPDASDDAEALAVAAILGEKNPVSLQLPDVHGDFELRYVTTQSDQILARRDILIEPAGRLAVVFERDNERTTTGGAGAIEIILDASGSMLKRDDNGVRRIETARQVLDELVREHLSPEQQFALRVFGHKEADKCRTDLEIPLTQLGQTDAPSVIASINAMNLARTPIADSLAKVPRDLAAAKGPKSVILITDGEETCDGDPAATIESLRARGLDLQVSIVGFAIADPELKTTFQSWAEIGGGEYFDAKSAEELSQSLRTVISGPFLVFNADGDEVGRGVIGGAEILLPAGSYRVQTSGGSLHVLENVKVEPSELTLVNF